MRPIGLNEYLSADNIWTLRLLGMEPFQQKRTAKLIEQEYNVEYYGKMLQNDCDNPDSLDTDTVEPNKEIVISLKDYLYAVPRWVFFKIKAGYMKSTLNKYARNSQFCELGAGHGGNFVFLEEDGYGGDFSENAVELGRLLGIDIHLLDFYDPETYDFIRSGTTVFT